MTRYISNSRIQPNSSIARVLTWCPSKDKLCINDIIDMTGVKDVCDFSWYTSCYTLKIQ